jgi:hypothetical protein
VIRAAVLPLALSAVLLTGCTDDGLDVGGLPDGACSDVSPALVDVDRVLRELGEDEVEPREAASAFADAQEVVEPAESTGGAVGEALVELRRQLGLFRISVDSNEYDGSQDEDVRGALDAVLSACRSA